MVSFLFLSQRESPREGGGESIYPETVIPDYPETVIPDYPETVIPDYPETVIPDYPETVIPDYPKTVIPDIFYRESTSAAADANFFHRDT